MTSDHKLTACATRAQFQLERAAEYLALVATVVTDDDDDPKRQFLYQTMVLMIQSFFEEYLRCVVALGSFWRTPEVRSHLGEAYQEPDRFDVMGAPEVGRVAQKRVSFDDRATKLRALMQVLVGVDPFAHPDVETRCLDFANVRNIIAHRGGWPDDDSAPTVRSSDVILTTSRIGGARFYKLRISRQFFGGCLSAIHLAIRTIETSAAKVREFRLPSAGP
jgi:hypothetical protein